MSKAKRGLDMLTFRKRRLAQYRSEDPDVDEIKELPDPHTWEDPDPSLRERIRPSTVAQWLATVVAVLVGGGLLLYFVPILDPAFGNPIIPIGAAVVGGLILFALWNQHVGFQRCARLDKSIVHFGDTAEVRFVESRGTTGDEQLVAPYVDASYGGFNLRHLKKRDLPYDPARLRSNMGRKDEVGEEPAVLRLNKTTVDVDTDTFGTIYVTHADELTFDYFARDSDMYTSLPDTIDQDTARRMKRLIQSLEGSIETLEEQVRTLETRTKELQGTREFAIADELRSALTLVGELNEMAYQHRRGHRKDETPDPATNGRGPVEEIMREVDEEMESEY